MEDEDGAGTRRRCVPPPICSRLQVLSPCFSSQGNTTSLTSNYCFSCSIFFFFKIKILW